MGKIDVTEVLCDPDMVDAITIIHRTSHVGDDGQNKLREDSLPSYGVVYPASGKTLERLPDKFKVANVMEFVLKGKIISDGEHKYPDLIVWNGSRFAVQVIFDFTNWGEGFCSGTCVRQKPAL